MTAGEKQQCPERWLQKACLLETGSPRELRQVPGARAHLVGDPTSLSFTGTPELTRTALHHRLRIPPSWTPTHSAACTAKSSTVSATAPRSARALETRTADTMRWPTSSTKPPRKEASDLRKRKLGFSVLDRPDDVWIPDGKDRKRHGP